MLPLTADNEVAGPDVSEDELRDLLDDSSEDRELPKIPLRSPPPLAPEGHNLPNVSRTDHRAQEKSLSSLSALEISELPVQNASSAPENYADHLSPTSRSHRTSPEERDTPKIDNPFLTLASKPAGNPSRKMRRKTARRTLQMQDPADDVLLEEASERNTIMREYKTSYLSLARSNPAFTQKQHLMSLAESSAGNELECEEGLQTQTLVFAQVKEKEHLQRESTLTAVNDFYLRICAQTYLCHHREVLQKSLTAYAKLILMQFEDLEEICRKQIRSDHTNTSNKAFGPDTLSVNRRVLGFTIKSHQSHSAPFSAAWRKMALLNTNGQPLYDPFQHTESTQANFLRTQGQLPGPCITHHPLKVSAGNRTWFDIVERDPPDADFSCHPPDETAPSKFHFTVPSIHFQTPWRQDTTFAESLGAWTTTWGESVKRSVFALQQMVELADPIADSQQKHFYQHLSKMVDLFMEYEILKWHAIISFLP